MNEWIARCQQIIYHKFTAESATNRSLQIWQHGQVTTNEELSSFLTQGVQLNFTAIVKLDKIDKRMQLWHTMRALYVDIADHI